MEKKSKILIIAIAVAIGMASCSTNKSVSQKHVNRPAPEVIQDALDSICAEGYSLYIAERINWISTDSVLKHCDVDNIGGSVIWQPTDSTWKAVFFDKKLKNCVFEYCYYAHSGKHTISYNVRTVTEVERTQYDLKNKMLNNALSLYADSLRFNSNYGSPNLDFVRIDANTIRMYILQGVERPNVIPFGNDYSIDFDNEGNVKAFRRYHQSLIAIPTIDKSGNPVATTFHSHLKDNPYITPTDICNFLLYRGEMKQTYVLSTALDGFIIFEAETHSAVFLTHEAMDRIYNNAESNKKAK